MSFVGRPSALEGAGEHYARLKRWTLTTVRFLVTWEAIEHAGPGIYDHAYLAAAIELAGEYGLQVFIDPHRDVWSRFTGGDGAPAGRIELLRAEQVLLYWPDPGQSLHSLRILPAGQRLAGWPAWNWPLGRCHRDHAALYWFQMSEKEHCLSFQAPRGQ